MGDIDWLKIVKWIFIVLIAGFIGQFGRMLANHFVSRAKLRKKKSPQKLVEDRESKKIAEAASTSPAESAKDKAKEEKKMLKALAKQKKKEAKTLQKKNE